jgi:hypothetical protein
MVMRVNSFLNPAIRRVAEIFAVNVSDKKARVLKY